MKIIEKLKKLIRHEQSARDIGNIGEAENFAAKIQELLDAHNLSMSQIDMEEARSSVDRSSDGQYALHQWQKIFVINIAELNGCQCVFSGKEITLIGGEEDRLIVFEVYRYFEKLARDFTNTSLQEWKLTAEYKRKRKKIYHSKLFVKSFLLGFVRALIRRFREHHEAAKRAASNEQALIFIGNKLANANQWVVQNLKISTTPIESPKYSKLKSDAYGKGYQAGNSVALTTQTIS